jgi:hypothetical protein
LHKSKQKPKQHSAAEAGEFESEIEATQLNNLFLLSNQRMLSSTPPPNLEFIL